MVWDSEKIENGGASIAGRLSAAEYNEMVADQKNRIASTEKGAASGVCPLNSSSEIDETYLNTDEIMVRAHKETEDLDDIVEGGCYRIENTNPNIPTGADWGQLLVIRGAGDTIVQMIGDYGSNNLWWRSSNPSEVGGIGSWNAWRRIYHSGREIDMNSNRMIGSKTITFSGEVDNGNSGTAFTVDWNNGQKQRSTLTGNCTFTFTSIAVGNFMLKLIQDATGSRTVTWPANVKWAGGTAPTLSTAASAVDIISFYYDGTSYYGMAGIGFA